MSIIGNAVTVGGGGGEPELLWTNPNPSADFGKAGTNVTISVDLTNYQGVIIKGKNNKNVDYWIWYAYFPKNIISASKPNYPKIVDFNTSSSYSDSGNYVRVVTSITNSSITFSLPYEVGGSSNISYLIPTHIYGVKWTI